MPRTHTNVSLSITPELMREAKEVAEAKGFGNSFSAYVAKLIADDVAASREDHLDDDAPTYHTKPREP